MRFIDKDKLLIAIQKPISYVLDADKGVYVELTSEQRKAIYNYINEFEEEDVVKCDMDYWMDCYNFYTRDWRFSDNDEYARTSFVIKHKDKQR